MSTFADSSALVKLYADEPGAELVRELTALAVSALARVEVPAAIWRKHRRGELGPNDAALLVSEFEADLAGPGRSDHPERSFAVVAVSAPTLAEAAALLPTHRLRAYDAVQLATAIAIRRADPTCSTFACFDRELAAAAAARGFVIVSDPQT